MRGEFLLHIEYCDLNLMRVAFASDQSTVNANDAI